LALQSFRPMGHFSANRNRLANRKMPQGIQRLGAAKLQADGAFFGQ